MFSHVFVYSDSGEMCAMKEVTLFSDDAKSKESAKQLAQVGLLHKYQSVRSIFFDYLEICIPDELIFEHVLLFIYFAGDCVVEPIKTSKYCPVLWLRDGQFLTVN